MKVLLILLTLLVAEFSWGGGYTFKEIKGRLQSNQNIDLSLLTIQMDLECWIPHWPDQSQFCGKVSQTVEIAKDGSFVIPALENPVGNTWKNNYVLKAMIYSIEIGSVQIAHTSVGTSEYKEVRKALKNGTLIIFNNVRTQLKLSNGSDVDQWLIELRRAGKIFSLGSRFMEKGVKEDYQSGGPYSQDIDSSNVELQSHHGFIYLIDTPKEKVREKYWLEISFYLSDKDSFKWKKRVAVNARVPLGDDGLEDYTSITIPNFD